MSRRPPLAQAAARMAAPLAALAAILATAGCGELVNQVKLAPTCPALAIVKDAADLTRFNGRGEDVTDLVLDARITAVPAACKPGGRGLVEAEVRVTAELIRGPAATSRRMAVPYFIVVTNEAGRILDKQDYTMAGDFPSNVDRLSASGQPVTLKLPVIAERGASPYTIYVGFALSPAEVAYNRKRDGG